MKVILSHGKESSPESRKIVRLKEIAESVGHDVITPDYREISSPEDRARHLLEILQVPGEEVILCGSSMGGYISLVATMESKASIVGLFLMAPALFLPDYAVQSFPAFSCPIEIVHAWQDEIVPFENVVRFGKEQRADLLMVDDDHRLSDSLSEVENRFRRLLERVATS